jgi:hypothetical protein
LAGTLTLDDPAVADEAILPNFSYLDYPTQRSNVSEKRIRGAFDRLLTPTLAFTVDSGWFHQNWPIGHTSGADKSDIGLKYEAYRDNRHEALVSAGLAWGIGHSGAAAVGADAPNTIQPGIFFGTGFGDLPDSLSWLRPFAVTASIVGETPVGSSRAAALAPNPATARFESVVEGCTGASRFDGGPPKNEPLNQLVPLVEFKFDSFRGQYTAATANPGLAYLAVRSPPKPFCPSTAQAGAAPAFASSCCCFLMN